MMVILNSIQLQPIIERAIFDACNVMPENLNIDSRHYVRSQPEWEVNAEFDLDGSHHQMTIVIDPISGDVRGIENDSEMPLPERR